MSSSSSNSSSSSQSSSSSSSKSSSSSSSKSSSSSSSKSSSSSSSKSSSSSSSKSSSSSSSKSSSSSQSSSSSSSKSKLSPSLGTEKYSFPDGQNNSASFKKSYTSNYDSSFTNLIRIRFDVNGLNKEVYGILNNFTREKFYLNTEKNDLYLVGEFFDRNNNSYKIINYLLSKKRIVDLYQYFISFIGIGFRSDISDLNYIFDTEFNSYDMIYENGWFLIRVKSSLIDKPESSINNTNSDISSYNKYYNTLLGATKISTKMYYDLFYTVNDYVSQTVLPKEYKYSTGGYLSDFSLFSTTLSTKHVFHDSMDVFLQINDYYESLKVGDSTEILINDEIILLELYKIYKEEGYARFLIKERGLYKTKTQAHYVGAIVKNLDKTDFFDSSFNSDLSYYNQYRCFGLKIKASSGNFMCTGLRSYFQWESSLNSTFDFGFEVPAIDQFIISGLSGTTSYINVNSVLLSVLKSQCNGKIFLYSMFVNLPLMIVAEDGSVHKRVIIGYSEKDNTITMDTPLPFSVSQSAQIVFGPSRSRISEKGIYLAEPSDGLFSGFLGSISGSIGNNQNVVYDIINLISNRRSSIIGPNDTIYIWIKRIIKNNNLTNFSQRLRFNFDCEVI